MLYPLLPIVKRGGRGSSSPSPSYVTLVRPCCAHTAIESAVSWHYPNPLPADYYRPLKRLGSVVPSILSRPRAPFSVRKIEWSTDTYVPGISPLNSPMVASPVPTRVLWIDSSGGFDTSPPGHTRSNISPMTCHEESKLTPALP